MKLLNGFYETLGIVRQEGLRKAWSLLGWRALAAIFLFYLIRDLILYVLFPALIIALA